MMVSLNEIEEASGAKGSGIETPVPGLFYSPIQISFYF
jgi:hypothetical protein